MTLIFEQQKIKEIILIKPQVFEDNRGYFFESFKKSEFIANGIDFDFKQENCSKSQKGVLRGLHYQIPPYEQTKIVRCTKGKIIDVAVDIRPNSKTFGQFVKVELSQENKYMLYIPKGFAHGFVALTDEVEIIYKTDEEYNPKSDRGIYWNDTDLNIDWGIDFIPILSTKDSKQPKFKDINLEELK